MRSLLHLLLVLMTLQVMAQAPVIEWQHEFGTGYQGERVYDMKSTPDGGVIVLGHKHCSNDTGTIFRSVWLIKYNGQGEIDWEKCYGGSGTDIGHDLEFTSDGGYVIAGETSSNDGDITGNNGSSDLWLLKLNANGDLVWQKCYGGSSWDKADAIKTTSDGGFIVVGTSNSNDGDVTMTQGFGDLWVMKVDDAGEILWQLTVGGSNYDSAFDVEILQDGYMVCGETKSNDGDVSGNHGDYDYWLVKLNLNGFFQWQKCLGGSLKDSARKLEKTEDGNFMLMGYFSSSNGDVVNAYGQQDIWLVKVDTTGEILWRKNYGGSGGDWLFANAIQNANGEWILAGDSNSNDGDLTENQGDFDMWLFKIDANGEIVWQGSYGGSGNDSYFYVSQIDDGFLVAGMSESSDGDIEGNDEGHLWVAKLTHDYFQVTGQVYVDLNSNFVRDPGEPRLGQWLVSDSLSDRITISQPITGDYELNFLEPGTYSIEPAPFSEYYQAVAAEGIIEPWGGGTIQVEADLRFQPISQFDDLKVELTPFTPVRPGFTARFLIQWRNVGTAFIGPTVVLQHDDILEYAMSTVDPTQVFSDSIIWSLPELTPFEQGSTVVHFNVSPNAQIGSDLVSVIRIEPDQNDVTPSDNSETVHSIITGSYDPNDILVDRNHILQSDLPTADALDYIIRFQNTGNDTAFTVLIKNPLPIRTDRFSFTYVGASHDVELDYSNDTQTMWFRFNNILLPDSNINEAASHGFVRYRIQPLTTLLPGDSILNQASIFFDFNEPVITNTAYTVIEAPTGISDHSSATFQMFPNPTNGILQIRLSSSTDHGTVLLYDIMGREVLRDQVAGTRHQIDLSGQAKGIYLVTLQTDQGISTQRLVLE